MNATAQPLTGRPARILTVASAGPLLVLLAFSTPLTTLVSTADALSANMGDQAWILSAMSVGAAAGLLSSGALGDDYGRRRIFCLGALLLALASALGGVATTAWVLIVGRILQGLGGAAIIACSLGLLSHCFPAGPARGRATSIWAAALGSGVALGPLLAAALNQWGGWQLSYWLTAMCALLLAMAGRWGLPEFRAAQPRKVDMAGTVLLGLGLTLLLAGLIEGRSGWHQPLVLVLIASGLALLLGFVIAERVQSSPMLDLSLFRRADFLGTTLAAFAAGAGVLSLVSYVPTLLMRFDHISALEASTVILAWSATSAVTAFGARWLTPWLTPHAQQWVGLFGVALAQLGLYGIGPDSSVLHAVLALLLAGMANGVLNAALGYQAVASVPPERAAMGSGANNTARYLGSAIGLAIVAVLISHPDNTPDPTVTITHGWNQAVLITVLFSLLGAIAVIATHRQPDIRQADRALSSPRR